MESKKSIEPFVENEISYSKRIRAECNWLVSLTEAMEKSTDIFDKKNLIQAFRRSNEKINYYISQLEELTEKTMDSRQETFK